MTRLRTLAGLAAAAALFAAPGASAQRLVARDVPVEYPAEHLHGGVHILTVLPNGSIGCDAATEAQAAQLRASDERAGEVRLTELPSLNRPGVSQFRIIIRATDQLLAQPAALLSFRRAAARWERIIQTPVTTVMDLDFGPLRFGTAYPNPNIIGSTNSAVRFLGSSAGSAEVRAAIAARQTDPGKLALVNAIPVPTPTTSVGEAGDAPFSLAIAGLVTRQALGFAPAAIDPNTPAGAFGQVPTIGFNSAFAYDFNPQDGITTGQTDFEAVAVHEIGHALGFTSNVGTSSGSAPYFQPWDLYRVRPGTVVPGESYTDGVGWEVTRRVITAGPPSASSVQVMFVGDDVYELSTATGSSTGGDGQQASHWRADDITGRYIGIMDPTLAAGDREEITDADIDALELFGYTVRRTPVTASAALAIAGNTVNIDFLTPTVREALPIAGGTLGVQVSNTGGPDALDFDIVVIQDSVQTLTPGTAPTVTIAPSTGSVAAGGTDSATLTVSAGPGGAIVYGRLQIRFNDPARAFAEVPFQISLGTPALVATGTTVTVPSGASAPASIEIGNSGDAPLTYVRVLEPAASDPVTAFQPLGGQPSVRLADPSEASEEADGGQAARAATRLDITGTTALRLYDLTQLPDGDLLAVDGGRAATTTIYRAPADLSAVSATYTSAATLGGQVTGIAYNTRTGSLWVAVQETGLLREVTLDGTTITPTGTQIQTGITPFGMDYSPELDAFFVTEVGTTSVYAFATQGQLLPGYPASVEGRSVAGATATPGVSFTDGLLEVNSLTSRLVEAGQFGRTVDGSTFTQLPTAVYGLQRSRRDPNGTFFFTSRTSGTSASIRSVDPTDLPAGVGTRIEAGGPLFSRALLASGERRVLPLIIDGVGLMQGTVQDELAFLTNSPAQRVQRFAVTINVSPVAGEDGPAAALDAVSTLPNPARGAAQVRLSLSAPAEVTVGVYNTLGQRVAVLAEGQALTAGEHAFPFQTGTLAAGIYVVRVQAGASVSTQKLTVIR